MIQFPDVSHYQAGLSLAGANACIAKASQGSSYRDPTFPVFRNQSKTIPFAAYHWINTEDLTAQSANAYGYIGPDIPVMWDCEAAGATVDRIVTLTNIYRKMGGIATMCYLPHWWWQDHLGSPDLTPLVNARLSLVSSNYSDAIALWAPYGGVKPTIGQFTDKFPFNGRLVDFNRFPGTIDQLISVFYGWVESDMWFFQLADLKIGRANGATIQYAGSEDEWKRWQSGYRTMTGQAPRVLWQQDPAPYLDGTFGKDITTIPAPTGIPDHMHFPGAVLPEKTS